MPYTTTNQYISWDHCQSQCPTKAIKQVNQHYCIDFTLCNGCQDSALPRCGSAFSRRSRCVPVNSESIPSTSGNRAPGLKDSNEEWDSWFVTYNRLITQLKATRELGRGLRLQGN